MGNGNSHHGLILEALQILLLDSNVERSSTATELQFLHSRLDQISRRIENLKEGDRGRIERAEDLAIMDEYSKARAKLQSIREHKEAIYEDVLKRIERARRQLDE